MAKIKQVFPGSEYRGYLAHACRASEWTDRYVGRGTIPCYRLDLDTPFSPGITDAEINERLKADLGEVFPDIELISHTECSNRAFDDDYVYVPFGCRKVVKWAEGLISLEILLFDEFTGFYAEEEDEEDEDLEGVDPAELGTSEEPLDFE